MPIWGGEEFEFFRPVFNIADTAISGGVISILVFQKKFLPPVTNKVTETEIPPTAP
jgi:signal peptidase II